MHILIKIRDFIIWAILMGLLIPFHILSYDRCLKLGRMLARMLFRFDARHRRVADENLRYAFPDKDEAWYSDMIRRTYDHLGVILADAIFGVQRNRDFFEKNVVFDPPSKEIEQAAIAEGTGLVLICGHVGTWELLVQYVGYCMPKGGGIYKTISNSFVDRWYKNVRERSGIRLFEMAEAQSAIRFIRSGGEVGFVADQNAGRDTGIFVNFFNRPACTFRGPVVMAQLANARMLFYTAIHDEDGKVHVRIKDLGRVKASDFPDRDTAVRHYTEAWVKALEEEVRLYPEQYFWVHQRWKTKPLPADAPLTPR